MTKQGQALAPVSNQGVCHHGAELMMNQIESTGKSEGLIYNFDTMLFGDTREAHTLAVAAREAGLGTQMSEKLFSAATTEGRSIFDRDVLIALAIEAGMTQSQAESALENPVFRDSVDDDEAKARAIGASGVPLFVINNKYAISGAQPAANFLSALRQVWEETKDESMMSLWDALRMNMMISYQELVRTFPIRSCIHIPATLTIFRPARMLNVFPCSSATYRLAVLIPPGQKECLLQKVWCYKKNAATMKYCVNTLSISYPSVIT